MTNDHLSMDVDEADEILCEVDVELHRTKHAVYLFQYPIRPHYRTYDETSFVNARIKEKFSLVEMDLLIDTRSQNYCAPKGKQFAEGITQENRNQFFDSDRMDKQTIASSNTVDGDRYLVGLFDTINRRLVLCPLKSIIQLRPQFNFLDTTLLAASGSTATKETNFIDDDQMSASDGEQSGSESEEKPEPIGTLVTMRFEKKESEYHKRKHLQSYNYYRQTRDSERWQDLACLMNAHSADAQRLRRQILSGKNQSQTIHAKN